MNTEDEFVTPTDPNEEPEQSTSEEPVAEQTAPQTPPPRPPRPKQPKTLPIFIGVLVVAAVIGAFIYFYGPGSELRPFKSHYSEYANTKGLKIATSPPVGLFGKVIIIDADRNEIDAATFRLPEDLRPTKHEDVGTVVIHVRQPPKEIGHYDEDQLAFVQVWRLILVDRASGTLFPWMDVEGPRPREKVTAREPNQVGPPPEDAMIQAIAGLKRLGK